MKGSWSSFPVSEDIVKEAINVYLKKSHDDTAGYRPWTHWNFIRSRTRLQRESLIREIVDYIRKNGVRDADEKREQKK